MTPLPIALISPHGSLAVPPELDGRIALTPAQIFNEADAYANDIYDFGDRALHFVTFPYARAIIDVNRPADPERHYRVGDSAIKRLTSYGRAVFRPGLAPDSALEADLVARYWAPWHERLAQIEADPRVKLVIDCHSMAAVGPTLYGDPNEVRPRVQAANLGDASGEIVPERGRISAPAGLTCFLAQALGEQFGDMDVLAPVGEDTAVNTPFFGGWDLRIHGHARQPWLMIELNRALYVGLQTGESAVVSPDFRRIEAIRRRLWAAIEKTVHYNLQDDPTGDVD